MLRYLNYSAVLGGLCLFPCSPFRDLILFCIFQGGHKFEVFRNLVSSFAANDLSVIRGVVLCDFRGEVWLSACLKQYRLKIDLGAYVIDVDII